jgi:hypothetical protein
LALGLALAVVVALSPSGADAHARGGGGRGHVVVGGFYGYAPWYGWGMGWGPWWGGPWGYYGPEGGVDMGSAMIAGFGAIELNAKPNRADVWVDGKYVGEARDLDGYPSYLWLAEGPHRVAVYKGGFATFDEQIDVHRGMKTKIKVRLQPGDSAPPGPKPGPGEKPAEEKK